MPLFTYVPMHCSLSIKPLWTRAVALLNYPGVLKSIFGALGTTLVSSFLSVCARQLSSSYSIVRTCIPKENFILQRLKVLLHILDSLVSEIVKTIHVLGITSSNRWEGALFGLEAHAWILSHQDHVMYLVGTAMGDGE